jgi:protein-tyrosine-phosphatase
MPKILIVCTANICRSPVAEALLRERLAAQEPDAWQISSAGTWASDGQPAARYSIELMDEQEIDISGHRSRPVSKALLREADLVLTMEEGHAEALKVEFPRHTGKIFLLTEMSDRHYSVPDPYGGPKSEYERMVREISGLIDQGLSRIVEIAQSNHEAQRA